MRGRRTGSDPSLSPLSLGSHIDSVPQGGNYDGPLGSLGAIEVAETLTDHGITTKHPLEIIIFQNEDHGSIVPRAIQVTVVNVIGSCTGKNDFVAPICIQIDDLKHI